LHKFSDDFYYLDIRQCARYFVTALFKELAYLPLVKREVSSLGLELPGLGLGFYDKVSVSKFEPGLGLGGYGLDYITGYKIINVYKPSLCDSHQRSSRRFHTPVCMLVTSATSTSKMSTGVTTKHFLTVRAWIPVQHPTTLECCMIQRKQPDSPLNEPQWGLTLIEPLRPYYLGLNRGSRSDGRKL